MTTAVHGTLIKKHSRTASNTSHDAEASPPRSPEVKRRKLDASPPNHAKCLSIVSWNIENPGPYLSAARVEDDAGSISSYFPKKTTTTKSGSTSSRRSPSSTDSLFNKRAPGSLPTLREIFHRHGDPTMVCLQEVRALKKDAEGVRALKRAGLASIPKHPQAGDVSSSGEDADSDDVYGSAHTSSPKKDDWPSYAAHLSLCQSKLGGKRFGVASYISSLFPYQYTAREVEWDAEGRIVIVTVDSLRLCVINVYALNSSEYDWKDPLTNKIKGTRSERKREFNRLLMTECQHLIKTRQYRVIMIGDFNISRDRRDCIPRLRTEHPHSLNRHEFNEIFIPTLDVVDVFRELHGDERSYSVSWHADVVCGSVVIVHEKAPIIAC